MLIACEESEGKMTTGAWRKLVVIYVHTDLKEWKGTDTEIWSSKVNMENLNDFVKLLYKTH